jgi:iron complex transport system permease protein
VFRPFALLVTVLFVTVITSLCVGPYGFDLELIDIRWTRVVLGALVGASLACTGCVLQAVLRNPLADPFVLGVSGGAAAFGSAGIIFLPFTHFLVAPTAAFCGAIIVSLALVYFIKREDEPSGDRVLLLGIAVNAFAASFITVVKTLAPAGDTQTLLFWLIGSVGYIDATWLTVLLVICLPCLIVLMTRSAGIEILKLGDEEATRLGIEVAKQKRLIYLCSSILIGICVSTCGMIAFVGLTTAHMLRPFLGSNERVLIPATVILGATIVVAVDSISRLSFLFFGTELVAGALLSLLLAPVFVWILMKRSAYASA